MGDKIFHKYEAEIIADLVSRDEQIYFKYIPVADDWAEAEKAQSRWERTPPLLRFLYRFGPLILAIITLYQSYYFNGFETLQRDLSLLVFIFAVFYGVEFFFFHRAEIKPIQRRNLIITDQRVISFYDGYDRQNPTHVVIVDKEDIETTFMDYHEGSPVIKLQTKAPANPVIIAQYKIDQVKAAISRLMTPSEATS